MLRQLALPLAATLAIAAAACGGSDDDGNAIPEATPAPSEASATAAPDASASATAVTSDDPSSVFDALIARAAAFEEVATWGRGANGVTFEAPNGLAIDTDDSIYVTEFQGGHLRKFAPDGSLLFEVAGNGVDPGNLGNPIGVAVASDGAIYVSESGNSRISSFNADGSFRALWAGPGGEPGQFRSAMGIAVSAAGEVFVADFGNHRVQVFTTEGGFVRTWGEFGDGPGQFNNPIGLQIGPAGDVWVVDTGNERVQVFDQQGELLRSYDDVGAGPQIVSLNSEGEFYVSSPWADSRVRRFSPDGGLLGIVGLSATPGRTRATVRRRPRHHRGGAAPPRPPRHGHRLDRRRLRRGHRERDRPQVRPRRALASARHRGTRGTRVAGGARYAPRNPHQTLLTRAGELHAVMDPAERLLYHHAVSHVWLETDGQTVRKEYEFGDPEVSRTIAHTEFDRLTQMAPVFARVPGLRSPRPISIAASEADDPPTVRMELSPGIPLTDAIVGLPLSVETLRSIADRMAIAAIMFVDTVGEPYRDFSFHNALYDAESGMVTVHDFIAVPPRGVQNTQLEPLERTLGNALGMVLRMLPRRARQPSLRQRWRLVRVVARVCVEAQRRSGPLPVHSSGISTRAWRSYIAYASRFSLLHRVWFRTVGAVVRYLTLRSYRRLAL